MFCITGSFGNTLEVQYFETPVQASFIQARITPTIISVAEYRKARDPAGGDKKARFHGINLQ